MVGMTRENSVPRERLTDRARAVIEADTNDFAELIRIAGIDPSSGLRFRDWSRVDFRGCDLRGFDFTGARLADCQFGGAFIEHARFDRAEIQGANLRRAADWDAHKSSWRRAAGIANDDRSLPPLAVFQDAPFAPEMVVIPAGRFTMGSHDEEFGRYPSEGPQHEVVIPNPIAVGRCPVTVEEWVFAMERSDFLEKTPIEALRAGYYVPITQVSLASVRLYIKWLNVASGKTYRLLTEAEWEFCCRAGTSTRYAFGDRDMVSFGDREGDLSDYAWWIGNSGEERHAVGQKKPNGWGLCDMHGGVWEWTQDSWSDNYKHKLDRHKQDGSERPHNRSTHHVVRGGSWRDYPLWLRSACRDKRSVDGSGNNIGFRLARSLA
jgi:formylglycine-generating enzyme required for sulfatase activity